MLLSITPKAVTFGHVLYFQLRDSGLRTLEHKEQFLSFSLLSNLTTSISDQHDEDQLNIIHLSLVIMLWLIFNTDVLPGHNSFLSGMFSTVLDIALELGASP